MTRTHEERLRAEMTIERDVWRENAPVKPIGQGQNPSDHRDQEHTAAWTEARFLVSGKETDAEAVRIAAELAIEGRGLAQAGRDAVELADAITAIHGTKELPDPVSLLVEGMENASREWRVERPVPEVSDPETAMAAARDEMRHLTRGHDVNDADVRMAAAMIATTDRMIPGGRELSSRSLADSMNPGRADSRKGVLEQAAASLSGRSSPSKGPVSEAAMPPFGATLIRKSPER